MALPIRPATEDDIPRLVDLLLLDAKERHAEDSILWKMAGDAAAQIEKALTYALTADQQPFRQFWLVAEVNGGLVGVIHAMMLPVPPIYAGENGEPGLILPDSFTAPDAPAGTVDALVAAAEEVLMQAGARILLSSFVMGPEWEASFHRRGYDPLTLYLSRTDLGVQSIPQNVRPATEADIPDIVAHSAENREVLHAIDPFWQIHPQADARFSSWMTRSLTLRDRDMLVIGEHPDLEGYAIAQPASRLHFPYAHDIKGTGVIDDYYHADLADPKHLGDTGQGAKALLHAAETAFANRGFDAAFIVCPAGWRSKREMLHDAGYEVAMTWSIKRG